MGLFTLDQSLDQVEPTGARGRRVAAQGCDQAEIAKELQMSRSTVKAYFNRMFLRAGLSDLTGIKRVQLAVMLHRERHFTPSDVPQQQESLKML